jgi:adenylylsulfate kinase
MHQKGFTIWLTGLSGAGKTTVARRFEALMEERGRHVEVLDGDVIRQNLSKGLGFSKEDRDTNIRRIGFVCELLTRNGAAVVASAISPYRNVRDELRAKIDDFVEVHVNCPLEVCIERDPKGLYKKALAGEIKDFTGIDDPYEAPLTPEVELHTDQETVDQSVGKILEKLVALGYLADGERES